MNRVKWSLSLVLILPVLILSYNNCGQPTAVPQIKFEGVATGNPFNGPTNTPPGGDPWGPKPPSKCISLETSDSRTRLTLSSSVNGWQRPQSLRAPASFYSKVTANECEKDD